MCQFLSSLDFSTSKIEAVLFQAANRMRLQASILAICGRWTCDCDTMGNNLLLTVSTSLHGGCHLSAVPVSTGCESLSSLHYRHTVCFCSSRSLSALTHTHTSVGKILFLLGKHNFWAIEYCMSNLFWGWGHRGAGPTNRTWMKIKHFVTPKYWFDGYINLKHLKPELISCQLNAKKISEQRFASSVLTAAKLDVNFDPSPPNLDETREEML